MKHDIEEMEGLPWDTIMTNLRYHAEKRMARFEWQGQRKAKRHTSQAEDIVQDAVVKFLDGSRQWNRTRYPRLYEFLRGIVDSEIEHRSKSWDNQHLWSMAVLTEAEQVQVSRTPDPTPGTEQTVMSQQAEEALTRWLTAFDESLHNDPPLRKLLAAVLDGVEHRRDLVALLDVTASDLDNARSRLQRRWLQFSKRTPTSGRR